MCSFLFCRLYRKVINYKSERFLNISTYSLYSNRTFFFILNEILFMRPEKENYMRIPIICFSSSKAIGSPAPSWICPFNVKPMKFNYQKRQKCFFDYEREKYFVQSSLSTLKCLPIVRTTQLSQNFFW